MSIRDINAMSEVVVEEQRAQAQAAARAQAKQGLPRRR